jgi:D-proline reductase (dithiol) PrdD
VYVILTGVDTNGKQCHEFGSSEGNMKDMLFLNRRGTPSDTDYIISFDVTLKAGMGQERPGPTAAHRACDKFIQTYREKLKKFKGEKCTERHDYHDVVRPGKKRVLIIKQVAGQGAMYDTHLFPKEPSGVEGGKSIIDMGNMPVILTPNEYRDGIIQRQCRRRWV